MISNAEVQKAYNDLYVPVRRYFWGLPAIEALADLEIAAYTTCFDVEDLIQKLTKFGQFIRDIRTEDEELDKNYSAFEDLLQNSDGSYSILNKVNEVVDYEAIKEQEVNDSEPFHERVFRGTVQQG